MALRHEIDVQQLRRSGPRPRTPKGPQEEAAYQLRKTFMGEDLPPRAYRVGGKPFASLDFRHVGRCVSQSYASNKWKGKRQFEEFKHLAEATQDLWAAPGALPSRMPWGKGPCGPVWCPGEDRVREPVVAELAPLLELGARLFVDERPDGEGVLGKGDVGCVRIVPQSCLLYAGYLVDEATPTAGEPCLVVASRTEGIQFLITGTKLDVTRDGIVG